MSCNPFYPDIPQNALLGVILCGGDSTRMGSDKGLLVKEQQPWALHIKRLYDELGLPSVFSIHPAQKQEYSIKIQSENLIEDINWREIGGPLRGLLSVHTKYPDQDLLVMPCDMQMMQSNILLDLVHNYIDKDGEHDVFAYKHQTVEPMPGIFTKEGLHKIAALAITHTLAKHSLKYMLEISNTCYVELGEKYLTFFHNSNTQHDIR